MSSRIKEKTDERDIVALNYLSAAELKGRYRSLTKEDPPRPMTRAQLLAAVAYETVRSPHRKRMRRVS